MVLSYMSVADGAAAAFGSARGGASTSPVDGSPLRASGAFTGPFHGTADLVTPTQAAQLAKISKELASSNLPNLNPKAAAAALAVNKLLPATLPTISCQPLSAGCDTVSSSSGGATGVKGLNVIDSTDLSTNLVVGTIEPADQGLCAGNGYVVETNNIGEIEVFNAGLKLVSGDISLDTLMGLTGLGFSSGGDVSCLYDYNNGGHWFITQFVSTTNESSGGTFAGCFAGVAFGCLEGIAVSVSNNPLGFYNTYFLNPNFNPSEPGYPYLLNDFAKIATTRDAFLVFYDEFPLNGSVPGIGGGFFNGAQEWAIDKTALELGYSVHSPYFNAVEENMGYLPTPDGTCASDNTYGLPAITCWYQVIPAQSPDPTQFDNSYGGSGFMLGALDFYGAGDTRIAVFGWTGLSHLNSYFCATCGGIGFGGQVFAGVESYYNPGIPAPQKAGPIPLGDNCGLILHNSVVSCPEGPVATNGDGFTQVALAQGQLWGAITTWVDQRYASGSGCPCYELHAGVAYFVIGTASFNAGGPFSLTNEEYVTAMHEDLEFPAMAAGGTKSQDGGNLAALITFTLSGNGGPKHADGGGFYPSTAYGRLTSSSEGLVSHVINVADKGKAPTDGFTEYSGYPGSTRPRWGDYSWAIFMPFSGGKVYFATNYIQYPNCSDAKFLIDPSCGGTRDLFANWGTSVNFAVA